MRTERGMRRLCALLALLLAACCGAAAEEAGAIDTVKALAWPYYEAAAGVAKDSPDLGRNFTDHKKAHALMATEKALEAGEAIRQAAAQGALGGEPAEGRVAFGADIDLMVLEGAALFHDTGMCGGGYAMTPAMNSDDTPLTDENGRQVFERNGRGLYVMHAEDRLDFAEIRTYHSLNSGLYVLVNRAGLAEAGYSDVQIDNMAAVCMAHSKSNSGVRDLNSRADWKECFDRLNSAVAAWNQDHPDGTIRFDRAPFEQDDKLMEALASEALAMRVGDVSRDSGPDAEVQTGETVHVDRDTLNDRGGSIPAEVEGASITIGVNDEDVNSQKSRQVHAGEQNITYNRTFFGDAGVLTHEITVVDGCSAPRCTQQSVDDHLGEFYSGREGQYEVRVLFERFEDGEDGFFRDSWEDFRVQAAQDYPNIGIVYPWDEEASK